MVNGNVKLKRLGVLSVAKIYGILGAILGLIIGFITTITSLMIGRIGSFVSQLPGGAPVTTGFFLGGVFAIIVLPIVYAILGFIGGAIGAFLYNIVAGWVGGIEVKFEEN